MTAAAPSHYARSLVVLHWLVAALVFALLATGWYMVDIPRNTDARAFWFNLHKSIGILGLFVIAALIVVRVRRKAPPLPDTMPGWERSAAAVNHAVFYLTMVLITASGYLTSSFSKYGPKLFGVPMPQLGWDSAAVREPLSRVHAVLAIAFAALIVLHVVAALKHLLFDKDGVFQRMSLH